MAMQICGAPCCWGVEDPKNPYIPAWQTMLKEAHEAGYRAVELGPYGYLPLDLNVVTRELEENEISIVAGTIFQDLVSKENHANVLRAADDICWMLTHLPKLPYHEGQKYPAPYLVIIDWGHDERDFTSGHSDRAKRLDPDQWNQLMEHIREICGHAAGFGVRVVIHPHAGGYLEFADEIDQLTSDIPYETAGLCLDTGHLYYAGMDPVTWLKKYAGRLDYVHFKDVNENIYREAMKQDSLRFFEGVAQGTMCPIGTGALDYPAIQRTLDEIGYSGYITIEQERDPRDSGATLSDVKASVDYLKSVGYRI
jgi:inosose dehydratase